MCVASSNEVVASASSIIIVELFPLQTITLEVPDTDISIL